MRINPSGEIVFEKGDLVRVTRNKLKSCHPRDLRCYF